MTTTRLTAALSLALVFGMFFAAAAQQDDAPPALDEALAVLVDVLAIPDAQKLDVVERINEAIQSRALTVEQVQVLLNAAQTGLENGTIQPEDVDKLIRNVTELMQNEDKSFDDAVDITLNFLESRAADDDDEDEDDDSGEDLNDDNAGKGNANDASGDDDDHSGKINTHDDQDDDHSGKNSDDDDNDDHSGKGNDDDGHDDDDDD